MATSEEVLEAIDGLRAVDGPLSRAKAVGNLWKVIRAAPSSERKELGLSLAQRYAPRLVEELADEDEVNQVQLLDLVRMLGRLEVDEIESFMDSMRDSSERRLLAESAMTAGLSALEETDLADGVDVEELLEIIVGVGGSPTARVINVVDDAHAQEPPEAGEESEESLSPADQAPPDPEDSSPPPERHEPYSHVAPSADAKPASVRRSSPDVLPTVSTLMPPNDPTPKQLEPNADSGTPIEQKQEPVDPAVSSRIIQARSPLVRLRLLNESPELARLPERDLLSLLAVYPSGWQRRRAVVAILGQRLPGGIASAVAVIFMLEQPMSRRWAASTVLDSWDLGLDEAEVFLEAVDIPSLRHRLVSNE